MPSTKELSKKSLLRLGEYLDHFTPCFLGKSGHGGVSRYVQGLLGPSSKKNFTQMWEELNDPGDYQALQHFVTSSPWDERPVWSQVRREMPTRKGIVIQDGVGIPKQGTQSVGVKRQYCGALGKIANCQVAVSSVLRANYHTWLAALDLYLPKEWIEDEERRERAEIPEEIVFRKKWEIALDQLAQIRDEDFEIECVVADAEYGDCVEYRSELANRRLCFIVGVSKETSVFPNPPRIVEGGPALGERGGRPRIRRIARDNPKPISVAEAIRRLPRKAWRKIRWRNGENLRWCRQKFAAIRVVPAHGWLQGEIHTECWLIAEQRPDEIRYHFSNLPPETSLRNLATMAHQRWPIEQNYRHLKTELGLDHFAGRKWNGWNHHAVLTAVAYTFLELECFRKIKKGLRVPLPALRKFIRRIFLSLYVAGDRELLELAIDFERDPPL